ncbi:hypothetical protein QO018_003819 [Azospirillum picis]|uniref:Uncharacterized protein n=2 Tax=Azospirillum picis TaxID=488438 RepID=A0ABU0MN94_9PROT|nr:hypothetical protein [Azospirillum picis]MDQ0534941.1 hypothetical protein [Azospirillum picis]
MSKEITPENKGGDFASSSPRQGELITVDEVITLAKEMMNDERIRKIAYRVKANGFLREKELDIVIKYGKAYLKRNGLSPHKSAATAFSLCRLVAEGRIPSVDSEEAVKRLAKNPFVEKKEK